MIDELVGHYRIVATLGSGGMGIVWKAIDTRLNRPVAIKAIRDSEAANLDAVLRLRAEAMAAASLDHPYICKIYELLETGSGTLVVMEFVEGEPLADIVSRRRPPLIDTLRYGSEIAEGLANAHARGIIHRDVKPGNVMITPHGHVKLLDFGVARINDPGAVTQSGLTLPGNVPGTPHYMAPEQALGLPLDGRADLFALGVLLFRCLTGQLPFEGETRDSYVQEMLAGRVRSIDTLASDVPMDVREIVTRCLAREPAKRPESAAKVAEDLRRSAELLSTGTAVVGVRPSPGLPTWALQVAILTLVLVAIAAVAWRWSPAGVPDAERRELVPVVTWPSAESDGRISPDGRWLSFVSDKQGAPGLFVQALEGGEPVPVSVPGAPLNHAWSPPGAEIAAISRQADGMYLVIVPAFFGGTPRLSVPLPRHAVAPSVRRWVGDTIFIDAIEFGKPGRVLWSFSGGTFDLLSGGWTLPFTIRGLDVSPDGKRVVLSGTDSGQVDLWTAGLDGSALRRLTDDAAVDRDPLWIDASSIVFVSTRGGQLDLWQMDVPSGRVTQLTSSLVTEEPTGASADGSVIVFEERPSIANLWRLDLLTGAVRQLSADALGDYWPSASADGARVVFQRARPLPAEGYQYFDARVMIASLSGTTLEPHAVDDGFGALISPDGEWIAYYQRLPTPDRLKLVARHTRTGEVRVLSEDAELPTLSLVPPVDWVDSNMAWRPSTAELHFVTKSEDRHRIQFANLAARGIVDTIAESATHQLNNLWFSATGDVLAYQTKAKDRSGAAELRIVQMRDRTSAVPSAAVPELVQRFERGRNELLLGWLGADRLLVQTARRSAEDGTMDLEWSETSTSGEVRTRAASPNCFQQTTRLDAAGRRLFVTCQVDGAHNIVLIGLDDGTVKPVTKNESPGSSFSGIHLLGKDAILFARDDRKRDIWIVRRTSTQ